MRLTQYEIDSINKAFVETFKDGEIYLFGSRTDDTARGGDIDLYIKTEDKKDLHKKKIEFLVKLQNLIGEQKVDIVFEKNVKRPIEIIANQKGVKLDTQRLKLEKYFHECDKHTQRINEAYEDMKSFMPITAEEYVSLKKEQVQAIDQYLFRFAKLQDTLGDKIFKLILLLHENNAEQKPFADVLNTLEKLEYIYSAKEWMKLRTIRNNISHQYDDEPEEMAGAINEIVVNKEVIVKIYEGVKSRYEELTRRI